MLTINLDSKLIVSNSINIQPTATKSLNFKELPDQIINLIFIIITMNDKSLLQRISVPERLLFFTPVLNNHKNIYLLKTKFKPIRLILYQNKTLYFTEIYLNKYFLRNL